ncbi:MAG: copper amine oxidase N-terminal domain-containing protein [Defluviitaleaceae bacterium]|nr:copper amine oxidase N-terminal domain-containing protein [Defluviitaleaceae bacterium]
MKRKVAILLAMLMLVSMPMSVFGRVQGIITQKSHAHGVDNSQPGNEERWHTFQIDAAWLSNQSLPNGTNPYLFLEVETTGGPSSGGNMVGMVGRSGVGSHTGDGAGTAAYELSFAAGSGFNYTASTHAGAAAVSGPALSVLNGYVGVDSNGWTWTGARHSLSVKSDGERVENRLWSSGVIDLTPLLITKTENGITTTGIRPMEGWINVRVPLQVGDPDGAIRIRLRATANGAVSTRATLLEGELVAGWSGGVNITSRGIVPITGRSRLQAIRITEDRNGLLNGPHTIRLVAPRGFRWDTGAMPGLSAQELVVIGNPVNFGPSVSQQRDNPVITIGDVNGTQTPLHWFNTVTDRDELYVRVNIPNRNQNPASVSERIWIDLEGLSLITLPSAPTSGNVAVDVYVGGNSWGQGNAVNSGTALEWAMPGDSIPAVTEGTRDRLEDLRGLGDVRRNASGIYEILRPLFGKFVESHSVNNWRNHGLVVGTLDDVGIVTIDGPAELFESLSGRTTSDFDTIGGNVGSNVQWAQNEFHTIRLTENFTGAMFRTFDIYELRPANEGVKIVDGRVRIGTERQRDIDVIWARPEENNADFIATSTNFRDGSMFFAPRSLDPADISNPDELRSMDLSLTFSIEAGYVALYDTDEVEVEIYRNNELLGTVEVGTVTDPIVVNTSASETIFRNQFDVLPLTPVSSFTVSETEANTLKSGDEIWFTVQAVQAGRIVDIPYGEMELFVDPPVQNEAESGFAVREIPGSKGLGWRVQRPSNAGGTPGSFTFENVYLAGPTVPGVEWRVMVHGPEITSNHLLPGQVAQTSGLHPVPNPNARYLGYVLDSANLAPDVDTNNTRYRERAVFRTLPYSATVLEVTGNPHIDGQAIVGPGGQGGFTRASFTVNTLAEVDGVSIQAIALPLVAPGVVSTMMNPRVFADFIGASVVWDDVARTATFTGVSMTGVQQTVVLTLDSPNISVNGQSFDIAVRAGQPALAGQISPVVINGRSYVPARVLAEIFGVPIDFRSGVVTLG